MKDLIVENKMEIKVVLYRTVFCEFHSFHNDETFPAVDSLKLNIEIYLIGGIYFLHS